MLNATTKYRNDPKRVLIIESAAIKNDWNANN